MPWPEPLKEKARLRLAEYLGGKRLIVLHPGSGNPSKNWPAERFAGLARKIMASSICLPVVVAGEADEKAIGIMRGLLPEAHFIVNSPLVDIASIISIAAGFAGNDSGITHLAAALNVPVVALFGPTDPAIWAPRGKNVTVIRNKSGRLADIEVEEVYSRLILCFKVPLDFS